MRRYAALRVCEAERIVPHLDRLEELEVFAGEVEPEIRERLCVSIEEARGFSPDHTIERGDALLAVQEKLDDPWRKLAVAAMRGCGRVRRPYQKAPDRMPAIQRLEKSSNLFSSPDG